MTSARKSQNFLDKPSGNIGHGRVEFRGDFPEGGERGSQKGLNVDFVEDSPSGGGWALGGGWGRGGRGRGAAEREMGGGPRPATSGGIVSGGRHWSRGTA